MIAAAQQVCNAAGRAGAGDGGAAQVAQTAKLRLDASNLIAIRIKSKFGRLSNLCGATVAGTGAACGITYLLGGGYHEICCAIQNMVGNVTGMVCDGAKADCALKISTCVNAACQAAAMGTRGVRVQSTDGIVEENVERTLDNFAILSTHGTSDSVILDLMLNKEHTPDAE